MGKYFEDLNLGDRFTTPARTVTEADIGAFAGLSGDYNPLHTDEEFAKKKIFKGRVAHGLLTLAIAEGLRARLGLLDGTALALLEINNLRFTAPVRAGDTIRLETEVVEKRETRRADRGVVTFRDAVRNQRDETVMESEVSVMLLRRPLK
ncbi:MAG: MaoC/PaaZ C-terminal domain-containing protein [Candidatus Geothermarchaeales archaeon]